ncbi:hypothetical protein [Streptomyces niveus]|uniref:hypothetical protein n=1 Tax=Streptomyces niveus TaxID=193462 RepID=UPI0014319307|nr:hypothetical protein [Streptomyces niveus]
MRFGGTDATSFTVVSAIQITVTAPAGPAGAVTTAGGTASGPAYTRVAAPGI